MAINVEPMRDPHSRSNGYIFLSGSIPDPTRWDGEFHPLEITDAVVAFARACLTHRYRIVTAAHPTVAPLLLYVAAEFPDASEAQIVIYQSQLFETVLPTATRRFEASGVGDLIWTDAAVGDEPRPGSWDASLNEMRSRMLMETDPLAAVFIGGMAGIREEFSSFTNLYPDRPTCAVRRPGGEASRLFSAGAGEVPGVGDDDLNLSYPSLWTRFLAEIPPSSSQ